MRIYAHLSPLAGAAGRSPQPFRGEMALLDPAAVIRGLIGGRNSSLLPRRSFRAPGDPGAAAAEVFGASILDTSASADSLVGSIYRNITHAGGDGRGERKVEHAVAAGTTNEVN